MSSAATWMQDMAEQIGSRPLRSLVLPGTHDSGTYAISTSSDFAPDNPVLGMVYDVLNGTVAASVIISRFPPLAGVITAAVAAGISAVAFKQIIVNYSICQNMNILQQLQAGIRYLDLRLTRTYAEIDGKSTANDIFICHGLYGDNVSVVLNDILTFLQQSPQEIVLVDMNHFYGFTTETHQEFVTQIIAQFGDLLIPNTVAADVTMDTLWDSTGRMILFYHGDQDKSTGATTAVQNNEPWLWPANTIPSEWFKTVTTMGQLFQSMQQQLNQASDYPYFWVDQGIISPETLKYIWTIIKHPTSSLYNTAKQITPAVSEWIREYWWNANPGLNVVIVNFPELGPFVETILTLNEHPNSVWSYSTEPPAGSGPLGNLYGDSTTITCPPGHVVIGVQFQVSSYAQGAINANRVQPVLISIPLDGSTTEPTYTFSNASGAVTPQLKNLWLDTTPLQIPADYHLIGIQLVQTSYATGFATGNRFAPVLTCYNPYDGSTLIVSNTTNNGYASNMSPMWLNPAPIMQPLGGAILQFQAMAYSLMPMFPFLMEPAILFDLDPLQNNTSAATWQPENMLTSDAIPEAAFNTLGDEPGYECPQGQLLVGRKHDGETEETHYYTAPLSLNGVALDFQDVQTGEPIPEWNGAAYVTSENRVLVGRRHEGGRYGNTEYKEAVLFVPNQPTAQVNLGSRLWTPEIPENATDFICPTDCVLTGQWHLGDQNGNTRYQFAKVLVALQPAN